LFVYYLFIYFFVVQELTSGLGRFGLEGLDHTQLDTHKR